eukprot:TRINITY_DN13577_c1_g2_i2.p1 TRINITY_DN13577_c1_g2~~TRINITY_DN13577_c1_g2_i2.p1  ORF type:complete len:542 (+),score=93.41 TRINITY_DN13577_c1_g2_i2:189-1814(+)
MAPAFGTVALAMLLGLFAFVPCGVSTCLPSEPNVDCTFHSLSSPKWAELLTDFEQLTTAWKFIVAGIQEYPAELFFGQGLVITTTNVDIGNIFTTLEMLQLGGFDLPVEIWYSGDVSTDVLETLTVSYEKLVIRNVASYVSLTGLPSTINGQGENDFQVKPLAIIHSAFEEVLYLDADNIPLLNPATLFSDLKDRATGALFWPDFWKTATENPIWSVLEVEAQGWELESGQIVVDKRRSWAAINLAFFLAKDAAFQKLVNGDKEALRLAFLATKTPFYMMDIPAAVAGVSTESGSFCGHTIVQHDPTGAALFLHHNGLKNGAAISWNIMKSVAPGKSPSVAARLPATTINNEPASCYDLAGPDVVVSTGSFAAFEAIFIQHLPAAHPALVKPFSSIEIPSEPPMTSRKLLQQGNGSFTQSPDADGRCPEDSPNYCFSSHGMSLKCCTIMCSGQFANPDQSVDSPQFCTTPGGGLDYDGMPIATTPSPSVLAAGVPPVDGGCAGSFSQPCYAAGSGQPSICCPTAYYQCAGTTGPQPFCRPI